MPTLNERELHAAQWLTTLGDNPDEADRIAFEQWRSDPHNHVALLALEHRCARLRMLAESTPEEDVNPPELVNVTVPRSTLTKAVIALSDSARQKIELSTDCIGTPDSLVFYRNGCELRPWRTSRARSASRITKYTSPNHHHHHQYNQGVHDHAIHSSRSGGRR